ncbi:MAG: DNA polymerase III subunit beta [Hyphomicrobiales bacterium]|nr:DNA polymerase III subunit beta [Hyphomicrobiales bacterium]
MKLTIDRGALLKAVGHVQSVVERRNTIPILSNVKLTAANGHLELAATDMDLEVVERVDADIASEGATTSPAHTMYDIVRRLPDGAQVVFDATGQDPMSLVCGRSRFSLSCLPIEDFPLMASGELASSFTLSADELRGLIDRSRFAISTEETRYYLNGIYLHQSNHDGVDVLRSVATDGHRLASVEVPLPPSAAGMPGVIIPRKTVAEVRKLIDEEEGDVEIALSETKIRFSVGRACLTSKLIDGTFPDYERVIPAHNDKHLDVRCKDFSDAVDRVAAISSDRSRAIKLKLADGLLVLTASSPEHGTAVEELEVQYQGESMEIGFNARYLLDIAQQIKGEQARFAMADAGSPTIVHEIGDASALYVLMPMRV